MILETASRFLSRYSIVIVGVFLAALPFFWIRSGYFINGEDGGMLTYDLLIDKASYMWTNTTGFGSVSTPLTGSLLIPVAIIYKLGSQMAISPSLVQKIFISISIIGIYISYYYFSKLFTKSKIIFVTSFFLYFFNFYMTGIFGYTAKVFQILLLPLLFYVSYKYFKTGGLKYLALNFIFVFTFQAIFTNLPQALSTFIVYVLCFFYSIVDGYDRVNRPKIIRFFVLIISIVPIIIFQSLFWYFSIYRSYSSNQPVVLFKAIYANISMIFQQRGAWWEYGGSGGIRYNDWLDYYDSPIVVASHYLIMIFLAWTAASSKKIKGRILFWVLVLLISIFLSSGGVVFPSVSKYLYEAFPLTNIFREPWAKFIPFVSFSISVIYLILLDRYGSFKKYIFCGILLTLSVVRGLPMLSKDLYSDNIGFKQTFVKPPEYWWNFSRWTKENKNLNIFPIPFQTSSMGFLYKWYDEGNGNTNMFMPYQFSAGNVFLSPTSQPFSKIIDIYLANKSFDFVNLGKVDTFLIQDDLVITNNKNLYEWEMIEVKKYISEKPIMVFNEKLKLYRLSEKYNTQKIIIPNNIYDIPTLDENTPKLLNDLGFNLGDLAIFKDQVGESSGNITKQKCNNEATVDFSYINPTLYRLKIKGISEKCNIVFFENYDKGWILKAGDKTVDEHYMANGFANGWLVDPDSICAEKNTTCKKSNSSTDIDALIEFVPQKIYFISLIFSICILFLSVLTVFTIFSIDVGRNNSKEA